MKHVVKSAVIGFAAMLAAGAASAAEIKVIASVGVKPKPDISSADAFQTTLLAARSIAYVKEGQSGAAMARIVERLGIAAQMAPKTILETRAESVVLDVVEGKADLAFNLISEILPVAGAELAGPLPAELQSYVVFTCGIGMTSKDQVAGKAFVDFLKAPTAVPVLKAKGMEPA